MNNRLSPFESWLEWNPEQRLLYRFIISQLHYDGLSAIAMILSQSLKQLNTIKPSNDLSQLVSMCVQWGQQASGVPGFGPILKPKATFPLLNHHSALLNTLVASNKQETLSNKVHDSLLNVVREGIFTKSTVRVPKIPKDVVNPETLPKVSPLLPEVNPVQATSRIAKSTVTPTTQHIPVSGNFSNINSNNSFNTISTPVNTDLFNLPKLINQEAVQIEDKTKERYVHSSKEKLGSGGIESGIIESRKMESGVLNSARMESGRMESRDESMGDVQTSPSVRIPDEVIKTEGHTSSSPKSPGTNDLDQGVSQYSPISDVNTWKCPKCETTVTNMTDLAVHIKLCLDSQGENYCKECGRGYSSKASLQRHISVVHRKERNYECHICRKRFGQQIHVDVHMRLHTGEKPFVCHICNDSFKQSAHLKRHMQCHVRSPSSEFSYKKTDSSPYKRVRTEPRISLVRSPTQISLTYLPQLSEGLKLHPLSERFPEPVESASLHSKYTLDLMKLIGQSKDYNGVNEVSR